MSLYRLLAWLHSLFFASYAKPLMIAVLYIHVQAHTGKLEQLGVMEYPIPNQHPNQVGWLMCEQIAHLNEPYLIGLLRQQDNRLIGSVCIAP